MSEQVAKLMKTLDITEQEALELLEYDEDVKKDRPTEYDLTEEQKKVAKKYTKADRQKTVNAYGKTVTRERKPDEDKRTIIELLFDTLCDEETFENVEIANKEKIITFNYNGNSYKLDLVKHRKNKGE